MNPGDGGSDPRQLLSPLSPFTPQEPLFPGCFGAQGRGPRKAFLDVQVDPELCCLSRAGYMEGILGEGCVCV